MKVVHIGYEHRADDVRIWHKECRSLAEVGYDTVYITLTHPNAQYTSENSCRVIELPFSPKHCSRLRHPIKYWKTVKHSKQDILERIYATAKQENAEIYHIHEFRLLHTGLRLKCDTGAKLIYDIHEDVPRQLENATIGRSPLYKLIKRIEASFVERRENRMAKQYDLLIAATPHIAERFCSVNPNTITVCNYPVVDVSKTSPPEYNPVRNSVCYVGTIFKARGISNLVEAVGQTDATLLLGGNLREEYRTELERIPGWTQVRSLGFLGRKDVEDTIRSSAAGLITPLPTGNIVFSLPVKMFEYMLYGIPVISSNFPTFREIVEGNNCGICVDPTNISEISNAITTVINSPQQARTMGMNGYHAVCAKYNWHTECLKLLVAYANLTGVKYAN